MTIQALEYDRTINAISAASDGVITTSAAHGLETGFVDISGCTGEYTLFNGTDWDFTRVSDTTFTIGEDSTGFAAFSGTATVTFRRHENAFDNAIAIGQTKNFKIGNIKTTDTCRFFVDTVADPVTALKDMLVQIFGRSDGSGEWHLLTTLSDSDLTFVAANIDGGTRFTAYSAAIPMLPRMRAKIGNEASGTADYRCWMLWDA